MGLHSIQGYGKLITKQSYNKSFPLNVYPRFCGATLESVRHPKHQLPAQKAGGSVFNAFLNQKVAREGVLIFR